jgi:hypothetical protein
VDALVRGALSALVLLGDGLRTGRSAREFALAPQLLVLLFVRPHRDAVFTSR